MPNGRIIPQWTAIHCTVRRIGPCEQCSDDIAHGQYRREVWIFWHPRYGYEFVIRRFHEHPECPKYRE